jgi:hypothetical protein
MTKCTHCGGDPTHKDDLSECDEEGLLTNQGSCTINKYSKELIDKCIKSFRPLDKGQTYCIKVDGKLCTARSGKSVWNTLAGAKNAINNTLGCYTTGREEDTTKNLREYLEKMGIVQIVEMKE